LCASLDGQVVNCICVWLYQYSFIC